MQVRTDLAIEAGEVFGKDNMPEGVTVKSEEGKNITVTTIEINNEKGSEALNKKQGRYVTIELNDVELNTLEIHNEVAEAICKELDKFFSHNKEKPSVMIIGLGNRYITPDSLGPKVVEKTVVTRHVQNMAKEGEIDSRLGNVCAIAPGVMGVTGIETGEIILGLAEKVKPDIIIAIDALAARKTSRINRTVQISDTGIVPGSGIGNRRMELSSETLNVPVVAIGVPTVVDAITLAKDLIENATGDKLSEGFEKEMMNSCGSDNIVTPKNIDTAVERMANAISNGLNMSVHKGFDFNDITDYLL